MKRFLWFFWLIGISSVCVMAQTRGRVTVSGTVIDKEDNSPVMQATVQLLSLPDSTMAVGNVTNNHGHFSLEARPGKYVLKVSFVGYLTYMKEYRLTSAKPTLNVGKIALSSDAIMLSEATVTAEAPQVTVSGDTLGYNASAYRTPEGAMLEELVKKIPGAEVDDDGNVKINGKEVKKLLVDGKEFFGGDVKTGSFKLDEWESTGVLKDSEYQVYKQGALYVKLDKDLWYKLNETDVKYSYDENENKIIIKGEMLLWRL